MISDQDLSLLERKENIKDKRNVQIVDSDFGDIKSRLKANLEDINAKFNITDLLESKTTDVENSKKACEDIWRAQIVFIASSFDYFLHEIIKFAILKMYGKQFSVTKNYNKIMVKLIVLEKLLNNPEDSSPLDEEIIRIFEITSFINIDKFKEVLNYIGIDYKQLANKFFNSKNTDNETKLSENLKEIFARRHVIAHQSDRELGGSTKNTINKTLVNKYFSIIDNITKLIIEFVQEKLDS